MYTRKQLFIVLIVGMVSLIGLITIALFNEDNWIQSWDQNLIFFIQDLESPILTKVMKFFTFIGSTSVVFTLSILMLIIFYFVLKQKNRLILFAIVMIGSPIINFLLKQLFHRERPNFHRLIEIGGYSFPSGHAMTAMTFYGIVCYLLWQRIPHMKGKFALLSLCSVFILMIGMSRIYLGVHFPSDIIGGYFGGIIWLMVTVYVFLRMQASKVA